MALRIGKHEQQWQNYAIVANLAAQTEEYQVALFQHCLGTNTLHVNIGLSFANERDKTKLSKIMEKLDEFTISEINETYERYVFNSRSQESEESIDVYLIKFCCGDHPFKKQKCPAWGAKCVKCGDRNHFASTCLKTKKSQHSDTAVK